MKSFLPGFGLAITLALLIVSCDSAPPPFPPDPPKQEAPPKSEKELRTILKQTCDEVNQFAKEEGFPVLIASTDSCKFQLEQNKYFDQTIALFDTSKEPLTVRAESLAASGRVVDFYNYTAAHAHQNSQASETPPAPKWTEDHTIEVASKFSDIFTKSWKQCLGKPIAHFEPEGGNIDAKTGKFVESEGKWEVKWGERTPSGIPCEFGGVSISLSEKYGPYSAFIDLGRAEYEDENIQPIAQNKAVHEAQKGLNAMLSEEGGSDGFLPNAQVLSQEPTAILAIIQPNKDCQWQPKGVPDSGFLNQSKARLAWIVTYKITTSDQYKHGNFKVYIDAKDGRLLCCISPFLLWWA